MPLQEKTLSLGSESAGRAGGVVNTTPSTTFGEAARGSTHDPRGSAGRGVRTGVFEGARAPSRAPSLAAERTLASRAFTSRGREAQAPMARARGGFDGCGCGPRAPGGHTQRNERADIFRAEVLRSDVQGLRLLEFAR